ncbi:TonB-dependent receptor [Pseudoalteromonas byunsanensis]|uniref:TonB-dependent receptor n=1 Tax=Pseudoalteromonas byunsanensis TaxID=327939 RepID=A0A1S1NE67_9GAMM|nr:TonB-dependent receptor [Pseudoalteromonas byunsanensis]OHU96653.1 TonB-dependent receptor [Pseudoalteromonas byunsanensis]
MKQTLPLSLVCSAVLGVLNLPVFATDDQQIEVIEVYAQKRAQSLNDVSVSITPVKGDELGVAGVKDSTELGSFVTNMKVSQNAAEGTPPAINIRGVGLLDYNTANTSPVAMYVDGASVGSANNQLVNFFDIEQVEVLKGPQGTLFGRNSTGGAVLIRSKRPDAGTYGELTLGIGSDQWGKIQGMYNTSLNDESAVRVALSHVKYDYTTYNLHPTAPEANMEQSDLRLSYFGQWDKFSVYLKTNYSHWSGIVQPVGNIGAIKNPQTLEFCSPQEAASGQCTDLFGFNDGSDDFWAVNVNNDSPHHSIGKGWTAEVEYQLSDKSQLVWINAFSRLNREHAFNCDGSPLQACEGNLGLKTELLNNELRYHREYEQGYLTSGLFHLDERIYQDNYNDILRVLRGTENGGNSATFMYDNEIRTKVLAAFAQYEWQWRSDTAVTFGLRYSDEVIEYDSLSHISVVDPNSMNDVVLPFYHVIGRNDDNGLSGKFAVNYTFDANKMLYYSFANGFKSGGYNGGYLSSPEQAEQADYGAEKLNAHEIGTKLLFVEQNLRLNAALFYYDYKDQQVFMNQPSKIPGAVPLQLLENVADSKIYGAEADLFFEPTEQLEIQLGVGYIPHAEFEEFIDPVGVSLTDNRLPFTSKWNINGEVSYSYSIASGTLKTSLGFDYQSEYYFDQLQTDYAKQDGYVLWRLNAHYETQKWQANIWAKNLFDEEYSHLKFDLRNFLGMLEDFKGEGRRVGLDVSYRF